jgi:hypothetical protein
VAGEKQMKGFLDETVRLRCNEIGGYWVKVTPPDIEDRRAMYAWGIAGKVDDDKIWVCRIPATIVEKAVDVIKEKRDSDNRTPPCVYLHGKHKHFKREDVHELEFKRLGFPEKTKDFNVCEIPYDDWTEGRNKLYPLTYPVAYNALKEEYHRFIEENPQKEKIYDNYKPLFPTLLLLVSTHPGHPGVGKPNVHYHINFDGNQQRLYNVIKERLELQLYAEQKPRDLHLYENQLIITQKGKDGQKGIFTAEIAPSSINAVPRITITKTTDDFDNSICSAVAETKREGQMVGRPPLYNIEDWPERTVKKADDWHSKRLMKKEKLKGKKEDEF